MGAELGHEKLNNIDDLCRVQIKQIMQLWDGTMDLTLQLGVSARFLHEVSHLNHHHQHGLYKKCSLMEQIRYWNNECEHLAQTTTGQYFLKWELKD